MIAMTQGLGGLNTLLLADDSITLATNGTTYSISYKGSDIKCLVNIRERYSHLGKLIKRCQDPCSVLKAVMALKRLMTNLLPFEVSFNNK